MCQVALALAGKDSSLRNSLYELVYIFCTIRV